MSPNGSADPTSPAPPPAGGGTAYHSAFGGLWVDRSDAEEMLHALLRQGKIGTQLAGKLASFIDNGFVIFEQAVGHAAIDRYLDELDRETAGRNRLLASVPVSGPQDKAVVPLTEADINQPLVKVLDSYFYLPGARALIFSPAIVEFLRIVFDESLLAFQGLHFEKGSTQAIHQDTAYVVVEQPMNLCASWIALEDVAPGSGELMYYKGSHRLPDWIYSGKYKHFNHERDAHREHLDHLKYLNDESARRGMALEHFRPRKGDVLIWAADLAHGGAPITDAAATRRSLVTHYTNYRNDPYYFRFKLPRPKKIRYARNCYYCSMYYNHLSRLKRLLRF